MVSGAFFLFAPNEVVQVVQVVQEAQLVVAATVVVVEAIMQEEQAVLVRAEEVDIPAFQVVQVVLEA